MTAVSLWHASWNFQQNIEWLGWDEDRLCHLFGIKACMPAKNVMPGPWINFRDNPAMNWACYVANKYWWIVYCLHNWQVWSEQMSCPHIPRGPMLDEASIQMHVYNSFCISFMREIEDSFKRVTNHLSICQKCKLCLTYDQDPARSTKRQSVIVTSAFSSDPTCKKFWSCL